jgi:hypothetical protein
MVLNSCQIDTMFESESGSSNLQKDVGPFIQNRWFAPAQLGICPRLAISIVVWGGEGLEGE